jgi:VanZ family protein
VLWLPRQRAILLAAGIALAIGTTTEVLQIIIPSRGATLLDLGANWLGIFAVAAWLLSRKSQQTQL